MSAFENPIIGNLRRINREQMELLSRIFTYVDDEGLGSIGRSRVDALIESHRALRAERDAMAAQLQGPDGFATWKDAAIDERLRRVAAENHKDAAGAERDALRAQHHLLASEMVYEGNSVQHWRAKALAYKDCAGAIYRLKQLTGADSPDSVVDAIQAEVYGNACSNIIREVEHCADTASRRCMYLANGEWHPATLLAEDGNVRWIRYNIYQHGPYYNTTDNPNHIHFTDKEES